MGFSWPSRERGMENGERVIAAVQGMVGKKKRVSSHW